MEGKEEEEEEEEEVEESKGSVVWVKGGRGKSIIGES